MEKKYLQSEVSEASEVMHLKLWEGTIFDYPFGVFTGTLAGGTGTPVSSPPGFVFSATNTQYISIVTGPTNVKTVSLWIKQDDISGNEYPISLNGTDYLFVVSGAVTVNGFTSANMYVNGVLGTSGVTAIVAGVWSYIAITDTTAVNASGLYIGRKFPTYYDGAISDVRLYSTVRTAAQIRDFYEQTRWRYGV